MEHNAHYLNRYIKIIEHYINNVPTENYHNHHICPRSTHSAYIRHSNNIVRLPVRAHYLVHYILSKAIKHSSYIYAFKMLRKYGKNSRIYNQFETEWRENISKCNKGRVRSQDVRDAVSKANIGKLVVTDGNKNFKISMSDPRYISGELKSYRVGYIHTEATKDKMSKNGIKGCTPLRINGEIKYKYTEDEVESSEISEVWTDEMRQRKSALVSDYVWYHDKITKKNCRLLSDAIPGENLTKGRYFDNPFSIKSDKKWVYCFILKKKLLVDGDAYQNSYTPHLQKDTPIYLKDDIVIVGKGQFLKSKHKLDEFKIFYKDTFVWKEGYKVCKI